MKACVTCGSSFPPAGWESCRACVTAGRASPPVCPKCGQRGKVRKGSCSTCRGGAQKTRPAVGGVRAPKRSPAPSPLRRERPASPKPARTRHHGRPYRRQDFVAPDGTLIPRGGQKSTRNAAWDRMRAQDAERAKAVRHLVRYSSHQKGALTPVTASMSSASESYDWWRYD